MLIIMAPKFVKYFGYFCEKIGLYNLSNKTNLVTLTASNFLHLPKAKRKVHFNYEIGKLWTIRELHQCTYVHIAED